MEDETRVKTITWSDTLSALELSSELGDVPWVALLASEQRGEGSLGITRTALLYALALRDDEVRSTLFPDPEQWEKFQLKSGVGLIEATELDRTVDTTISSHTRDVLEKYRESIDGPPYVLRPAALTLTILHPAGPSLEFNQQAQTAIDSGPRVQAWKEAV